MSGVKHAVPLCPPGPSDVRLHWLENGRRLARPVSEHRQPLGPLGVLISSWLHEGPLLKDARYTCVAQAESGSDMSEVDLHLTIGGTWAPSAVVSANSLGGLGGGVVRARGSTHEGSCCLADEESIPTRDLSQWRGALNEHEQMLKRWQKAWVGLCMHACMSAACT